MLYFSYLCVQIIMHRWISTLLDLHPTYVHYNIIWFKRFAFDCWLSSMLHVVLAESYKPPWASVISTRKWYAVTMSKLIVWVGKNLMMPSFRNLCQGFNEKWRSPICPFPESLTNSLSVRLCFTKRNPLVEISQLKGSMKLSPGSDWKKKKIIHVWFPR